MEVKAVRKHGKRFAGQRGFTLVEMLMATAIVIVGLVAVAQLVPASVMLSSSNRNDGAALVFGQKVLEAMREQPLTATSYSDPNGIVCPLSQLCQLGDPTLPKTVVGSPVVLFQNSPIIDFTASPVANYSFTYSDPNDPEGTTTDVRWAVIMNTNPTSGVPISRRIILGVFRRGMRSVTYPVTLDVILEK
ncbi:MAG: prepilin-type N-terminal cleavage/methylation domain-containing protein [Candidatus Acidiferrum sp.]